MGKADLGKMLEDLRSLTRSEQTELRSALDALLAESGPDSAEDQVERLLFERGSLSEMKGPITDLEPYRNRELVHVQGKPLSEVIIEERR